MREGCGCDEMRSHDLRRMTVHCKRFFVPHKWSVGRRMKGQRYILLEGICDSCGQELSIGFALPNDAVQSDFFSLAYDALSTWRPFSSDGVRSEQFGTAPERRAFWYRQQNKLPPDARRDRFLSLFNGGERAAASEWLTAQGD